MLLALLISGYKFASGLNGLSLIIFVRPVIFTTGFLEHVFFLIVNIAKKKKQTKKTNWASQVTLVKNLPANAGDTGDMGSIPGSERSLGGRNGKPLQYSCLGNPIDRGA